MRDGMIRDSIEAMTMLRQYLHEPVNTLTHLLGAAASVAGLLVLVVLTWGDWPRLATMLVYGLSLIFLFTASSLMHGIKTNPRYHFWLNRLDHAAIFLLIAGTYTPIAYNLFPSPWNWLILVGVWTAVLVGVFYKTTSQQIHGFLNVSIYVILGWGAALPLFLATTMFNLIPWQGVLWLLAGGLIYSMGFIIYYRRWPDPWPDTFGHHEIWHLFVMGGCLCHYLFILMYVALV